MPYVNNNGVKIYYEVEGQGPPLVLAHGITRNLQTWYRTGYVDALRNDFTLILFDARGHGRSDKPHDPSAYGTRMAHDVVTILDEMEILKADYLGYSMGSGVGFIAAVRYPDRFNRFVFGGWSPFRREAANSLPSQQNVAQQLLTLKTDPNGFLQSRQAQLGRPWTSEERDEQLSNDAEALVAIVTSFRDIAFGEQELSRVSVPCLLYAGNVDPAYAGAMQATSHIPHARFVSLPGLNHLQVGFAKSDLVLPHVKEFLAEVNT